MNADRARERLTYEERDRHWLRLDGDGVVCACGEFQSNAGPEAHWRQFLAHLDAVAEGTP